MNEPSNGAPEAGERKFKVVYTIIERKSQGKKDFWLRIGTAFANKDSSWNVHLDAHPVNGKLHIRDYEPYVEGKFNRDQPRQDPSAPRFDTRPRQDNYHPHAPEGALR